MYLDTDCMMLFLYKALDRVVEAGRRGNSCECVHDLLFFSVL